MAEPSAAEGMDTGPEREGEREGTNDDQGNTASDAAQHETGNSQTDATASEAEGGGVVANGDSEQQDKDSTQREDDQESKMDQVPDYNTQKEEINPLLSQRLKCGDCWYLIDQRWLKQWKRYVGFDTWDLRSAGKQETNPGPVDNASLFKSAQNDALKDHLMEELDYALVPKAAWEKFERWYSLSEGSKPIERFVVEYGTYVKHLKVEVYLIEFKLCIHPHVNETKTEYFSRSCTITQLQARVHSLFEVPEEAECRLWQRYMTNTYELLNKQSETISEAGLYGGQLIMLERKTSDGNWPRQSSTTTTTSSTVSTSRSISTGSSWSYYDRREPTQPGLCGLSNLGNTCFMNSALQCLSNTQPLADYFIGRNGEKPYIKHINKTNPLGMGGALAETYGALLENIWGGQTSYLAPREFKVMIGRHAPQFSGYAQQDSHELLAFLLDGLHEDLNLVKKKPYVDMDITTEGRDDKDVAEETWQKYLLRNQSVIVRYFQGQLKSTLVCPHCSKVSRIFDPFMYLSLPLPAKKVREMTVVVVRADPMADVLKYKVTVPKHGIITDLKEALQKLIGTDCNKLVVVDVYNGRFHRVYYDNDSLHSIMDRDDIYLYELQKPLGDPDWVPVPVYQRELKSTKSYYYGTSKTSTYGTVFGLPIIITVPRKGCTYSSLYDIIVTQCSRYVTTPVEETPPSSSDPDKEGDKEEGEEEEEDEGEKEKSTNDGVQEMELCVTKEPEPSDQGGQEGEGDGDEEGNMDTSEDNKETDKVEEIKEDEEQESVETKEESGKKRLFTLVVVNSYGSQEVNRLADNDKPLKLTSQTYIACDWEPEVMDKHYDLTVALSTTRHSSCDEASQVKKTFDIYDCLDMFVVTETLGKEDAWYCPSCKDFVEATKKFDLWKMPQVLVIHLKRFSYTRYYRNKLELTIDFPLTGLDLSKYIVNENDPQPLYDLYAVSNHFGGLGGGHYTAYAKNKETGKWYNFDDSHVSETSASNVVSPAAYVLFYHRRTEGRPAGRSELNRSLSVSFEEEVKKGSRFRPSNETPQLAESMEVDQEDSNKIAEERQKEIDENSNQEEEVFQNPSPESSPTH